MGILQALLRVRKEAGKIGFVQAGSPTPTPDILGRSGSDDSDQPHGRKKKKKKKKRARARFQGRKTKQTPNKQTNAPTYFGLFLERFG